MKTNTIQWVKPSLADWSGKPRPACEPSYATKLAPPRRASTLPEVVQAVVLATCEHYGHTLTSLLSRVRTHPLALHRQIAMALSRELSRDSTTRIAAAFGRDDHTTILYACKVVAAESETDADFLHDVETIKLNAKRRLGRSI